MKAPVIILFFLNAILLNAQDIIPLSTNSIILSAQDQQNLKALLKKDQNAQKLFEPILQEAKNYLDDKPLPLEVLNYEGMLDTDPARIKTEISLSDMAKINTLYYAAYGDTNPKYGAKIKEFVMSWAKTYFPDGNTINENKFVTLFWGYYLYEELFSEEEQQLVENWMMDIANHQLERTHTPNNNWQVKRIKIIGLVGGITGNQSKIDTAVLWTKEFINSSLYPDGTSNDLRSRDALHYHNSGLRSLLTLCINLSIFDTRFHLYEYVSENGGSIKKSVDYVVPYALGEKQHKEWVNTTVELDRKRAAAGIEKYQTGKLYDPEESLPQFEFACFYDQKLFEVIAHLLETEKSFTQTWESMLNSPLVRKE
tara:strand:- start:1635 stop:2738 length:1104 start_codon:yes stop_codon:yes gene_type:complete